jgi:BarA-like signal transduction histidine kinase
MILALLTLVRLKMAHRSAVAVNAHNVASASQLKRSHSSTSLSDLVQPSRLLVKKFWSAYVKPAKVAQWAKMI